MQRRRCIRSHQQMLPMIVLSALLRHIDELTVTWVVMVGVGERVAMRIKTYPEDSPYCTVLTEYTGTVVDYYSTCWKL